MISFKFHFPGAKKSKLTFLIEYQNAAVLSTVLFWYDDPKNLNSVC